MNTSPLQRQRLRSTGNATNYIGTQTQQKKNEQTQTCKLVDDLLGFEWEKDNSNYNVVRRTKTIDFATVGHGPGTESVGIGGTLYGAVMGAGEAIEHYYGGNKIADRGQWILNGGGATYNKKLFELAKVFAK